MSKTINTIETDVRNVCNELRNDCKPESVQRLTIALRQGTAAIEADSGFIAYTKAASLNVPQNDWNGLASAVREAVAAWEMAVLYRAQVIHHKTR
jgi:hypothetical protein